MAYQNFAAELEDKADKIPRMDVRDVNDAKGHVFVDFRGDDVPGVAISAKYDLKLKGVLDEETAAENGATEGCKVAIFEEAN